MLDHEDHREIGKRLDLFHFEDVAPGMVFWHPRGWAVYRQLEEAVRSAVARAGYREVRSPQIMRRSIWEESGHWRHFREGMFCFRDGGEDAAIKPVSCPGHAHIVSRRVVSYRELPIRLSGLGLVHRDEPSGALQGLLRLRQFAQDDGHVFCSDEQVESELESFLASVGPFYSAFGFSSVEWALSLRPAERGGEEADWDRAEARLARVLDGLGLRYDVQPGGGAFYGPKVEIVLRDRLGRQWQCGTIQLDVMPQRFGLEYMGPDGERRPQSMLHRALYGSLERFMAMLLEQHGSRLPVWLAPEQAVVLPVGDEQSEAAAGLAAELVRAGARVEVDRRSESLGKRIAEAHGRGVPYVLVLGPKELASGSVALRFQDRSLVLAKDAAIAELLAAARPPSFGSALGLGG